MQGQKEQLIVEKSSQGSSIGRKVMKLVNVILVIMIILILSIPIVYLLGSKRVHIHNMNPLYDVFEDSPQHKELYKQLAKTKYSSVYGQKQSGVFSFIDHYANKQQLKQKQVVLHNFDDPFNFMIEWIENYRDFIEDIFDLQDKQRHIWILSTQSEQPIPQSSIQKIMARYPKDKILLVSTNKQQFDKFEVFQFPQITQYEIKQSIQKKFELDEISADILYDFYITPQNVIQSLDIGQYSQQALLEDHYRQWIEFTKQETRILKDLCKKGQLKTQMITDPLAQFGLITYKSNIYWANKYFMLNYQLHKKIKCAPQGIASQQILSLIEQSQPQNNQNTQEQKQTKKKSKSSKKKPKKNNKQK